MRERIETPVTTRSAWLGIRRAESARERTDARTFMHPVDFMILGILYLAFGPPYDWAGWAIILVIVVWAAVCTARQLAAKWVCDRVGHEPYVPVPEVPAAVYCRRCDLPVTPESD